MSNKPTAYGRCQEDATRAAARLLARAHTFAALHASAKPLFQKQMKRPGAAPVLVRLVWPGVLTVCDPATGEELARSAMPPALALDPAFRLASAAGHAA